MLLQVLQECCITPNLIPSTVLYKCAPVNGRITTYQSNPSWNNNVYGPRSIVRYNGGLFGAIRNFFGVGKRRKRQDDTTAAPTDASSDTTVGTGDTTASDSTAAPSDSTAAPSSDTTASGGTTAVTKSSAPQLRKL